MLGPTHLWAMAVFETQLRPAGLSLGWICWVKSGYLAKIFAAWHTLPESIKRAILALIW
jgi:hypothetical protein